MPMMPSKYGNIIYLVMGFVRGSVVVNTYCSIAKIVAAPMPRGMLTCPCVLRCSRLWIPQR